ncbi:alanine racemase [Flavobacteriaceae bacterium F89]|uniref:Alanine racemase n=1 Tax=Cerina litoralis TaxID=2874477 RepID=A0AAE3EQM4_9FLAO|nr:alanine racemase [Cerina litoralis]MCG2459282.1 alanine racemase [Cerina litoralis]
MPKVTETVLEIDLDSLAHNYNFLRSKLNPTTKFMAVVKAFAYGSEAPATAIKLEKLGVDYLAVAYANEGIALRNGGIKTPILVLHPLAANFASIIDYGLEPSIYSIKILLEFLEVANSMNQKDYPIHLKFNTGLNRLGFGENDLELVSDHLLKATDVRVVSAFSHLAASEDKSERAFTLDQIAIYETIFHKLGGNLGYVPMKHILNTSGIINYPEAQFNMVRSGIGLYGYGNEPSVDAHLKPMATLKTLISQLHRIGTHESVGYNRAYLSDKPRVTATLPLGHADGIGRHYGNGNTFVSINGQKAPIIGNVCMDMIMVDVTEIDCQEGDEVIVFGHHPTAEEFAFTAQTISYELLSGISQRVKRVIIGK